MDVSFMPNGKWFCFCTETGKTLAKGFRSKVGAVVWMGKELARLAEEAAA